MTNEDFMTISSIGKSFIAVSVCLAMVSVAKAVDYPFIPGKGLLVSPGVYDGLSTSIGTTTREPQPTGWPLDNTLFPGETTWVQNSVIHWPPISVLGNKGRDLLPQFPNPDSATVMYQDSLVKNIQLQNGNVDVILIGDSITQQWMDDDWRKANIQSPQIGMNSAWKNTFPGVSVVDLGIGGDKVEGVLWRLEHNGITNINAKVVVLCIGTNDVGWVMDQRFGNATWDSIALGVAKGINLCVQNIRERIPRADVVVCKVLPAQLNDPDRPERETYYKAVVDINAKVDSLNLGADPKVHVLDCRKVFLKGYDPALSLAAIPEPPPNTPIDLPVFRTDTPALVHITLEGYQRWARVLEPTIKSFLGGAPSITTQPKGATLAAGQSATLTVVATGPGLTYQWRKRGQNIPSATAATYVTPVLQASDNGATFSVEVRNNAALSVVSNVVAMNVVNEVAKSPTITTNPLAATVNEGQTVTFRVAASGVPAPTYQWFRNGSPISGATAESYTTPAMTAEDDPVSIISGTTTQVYTKSPVYSVVASNSAGSVTSNPVKVHVVYTPQAPIITLQPASVTTKVGVLATFGVVVTAKPAASYSWQRNDQAIPGSASGSCTTPMTKLTDSGTKYRVVVTNPVGTATSNEAILTVTSTATPVAPKINVQPVAQSVMVGQPVTFTVTASGTPPLVYQWQRNGTPIANAMESSFTIPITRLLDDSSLFSVVVSNGAGTWSAATSNLVKLTVTPTAQVISGFTTFGTHTYGNGPFSITGVTGGASGQSVVFTSNNTDVATVSGKTVTIRGAGTAVITANQAGNTTYAPATPVRQTLTIAKAALSITAANASRIFGAANPTFTGTITGVVSGDIITATYASSANATTTAGVYGPATPQAIIPTPVGSRLGNYQLTLTNGTLTITRASSLSTTLTVKSDGGDSGVGVDSSGGGGCGAGAGLGLLVTLLGQGLHRRRRGSANKTG